ncbi:MAG TPA: hypothetical protein VJL60_02075 [Gammaproteobacteria bacterium]|nr:hypothetical protein [Gammaproteobacteria bacterium]
MPVKTPLSELTRLRPERGWPTKYGHRPLERKPLVLGSLSPLRSVLDRVQHTPPPATTTGTPMQALPKPGK